MGRKYKLVVSAILLLLAGMISAHWFLIVSTLYTTFATSVVSIVGIYCGMNVFQKKVVPLREQNEQTGEL